MKKAIAIIAALALLVTFAIGVSPSSADALVSVIEDFEDGLGDWSAAPATTSFTPQTITVAHETEDTLEGDGSLAWSLVPPDFDHLGWWQAIGTPWDTVESANWDGVVFRMDASSVALAEKSAAALMNCYFGMEAGTGSTAFVRFSDRIKFIALDGEDVTIDWDSDGGNYHNGFCYIPVGFNGYVFCNYEGMAEAATALSFELSFVDDVHTVDGEIITVDQYAYYNGTDYDAVIAELEATAPTDAPTATVGPTAPPDLGDGVVLYDFEDGISGWAKTGWDAGDSMEFAADTDEALIGDGSLRFDMPDVAVPVLNGWQAVENTFPASEAANWDGIAVRVDASDFAAGYGDSVFIVVGTVKPGAATGYMNGAKFIDLDGNEVPTGGGTAENPIQLRLPDAFNGWVFLPFEGNITPENLALQTTIMVGASDYYFVKDVAGRSMTIDQICFYSGSDFEALQGTLSTADKYIPYVAPEVFEHFEDGIDSVGNVWMGHDQNAYERYAETENALIGRGSLGMDINGAPSGTAFGYDGFAFTNVDFQKAFEEGRTGVVCRFKVSIPGTITAGTIGLIPNGVSSSGGTGNLADGYVITDDDGVEIYSGHMYAADRFLIEENEIDGWLFLPFTATDDNGTTYVNDDGANPLDALHFCFTGLPEGSNVTVDQVAFYTSDDYAQTIEDLQGYIPYADPDVWETFEDGIGNVGNVWMGHDQNAYERYDEMENPLVGENSLGMDIHGAPSGTAFGYDGFGFSNVNYQYAFETGMTGIVCRFKVSIPGTIAPGTIGLIPSGVSSAGGTANLADGYVITDNDGNVIYSGHMYAADRFLIEQNEIDGWLFLTFTAAQNNGTTYVNEGGANPLDALQFCFTGFPEGSNVTVDQFAFYRGSEYSEVIQGLLNYIAPTDPPTEVPTEAPTATDNTPDDNDDTSDISMVFYAVAAMGAASTLLVFRKRK